MSLPYSNAIMFLPISPNPPRGMTLNLCFGMVFPLPFIQDMALKQA
jgi:hypothetical protein